MTWPSDEVMPTAAMATVVPTYAISLITGAQEVGTMPNDRAAAATRKSTRHGGTNFHHFGRVAASEVGCVRHDSYGASGMIASIRVRLDAAHQLADEGAGRHVEGVDEAPDLGRLLAGLPPDQRHVITRRFGLDGPPTTRAALADELGLSESTVGRLDL